MDAAGKQPWRDSGHGALRRTRFVCISDTHNCTVKLPKGDVLIHAGDLTNQGSISELKKAVAWLEKADFEVKIVVAGNHDLGLDRQFYEQYGDYFHSNQDKTSPEECIKLLESSPSLTYLNQTSQTIRLSHPKGPQTTFKVFGSPYSPRCGAWAFGYERSDAWRPDAELPSNRKNLPSMEEYRAPSTADEIWSAIPLDTDIVVTHTPPHLHRDEAVSQRRSLGCEDLRRTLWRVRPRLAVCGHVHEGRGAERVTWDIDGSRAESANVAYGERSVEQWQDPDADSGKSAKISLLDLTSRHGYCPLDNDGSHPMPTTSTDLEVADGTMSHGPAHPEARSADSARPGCGTRGLGGNPDTSVRCDGPALKGRMGRKETCVVNCAIMASSYPHRGGKRLNKAIVVDLDLPVAITPR